MYHHVIYIYIHIFHIAMVTMVHGLQIAQEQLFISVMVSHSQM